MLRRADLNERRCEGEGHRQHCRVEQLQNLTVVMSPIAKALSENDISDVTAYYSGVNAPFLPLSTNTDAELHDRGKHLATIGSEEKGIPGQTSRLRSRAYRCRPPVAGRG